MKNRPILTTFGTWHQEKTWRKWL